MKAILARFVLAAALLSSAIVTSASADLGPLGMTRYVSFVTRPVGMSHADFMAALTAQAMKAKTLNHPLGGLVISDVIPPANPRGPQLDTDAMVEVWTADEADHAALLATADGRRWQTGMEALYGKNTTYVSREHLFTIPDRRNGTTRSVGLLVRKNGWNHVDFMAHWLGIHGVMATKVPGLIGFILTDFQKTESPKGDLVIPETDGMSELWWQSPPGAADGTSVPSDYASGWYKDGDTFIQRDASRNLSVRGIVIIPVSE
jgi:hypothetical protein